MHTRPITRRHFLASLAPGLALAALLPACGSSTTVSPSAPRSRSASAPTSTPTSSLASAPRIYFGDSSCSITYPRIRLPSDPYAQHLILERRPIRFAEKVLQWSQLIVVGTVRDILPARWVTPDSRRPFNPHADKNLRIITPVRVQVERVAKGSYPLPDVYLAALGGRIGADCASYSGSGPWPEFGLGERYLYFLDPFDGNLPGPVPLDDQYRYFDPNYSYTVRPDGTLTIGPECGIVGCVDSPPRTLTVDETLREIAALLATPSGTPTR